MGFVFLLAGVVTGALALAMRGRGTPGNIATWEDILSRPGTRDQTVFFLMPGLAATLFFSGLLLLTTGGNVNVFVTGLVFLCLLVSGFITLVWGCFGLPYPLALTPSWFRPLKEQQIRREKRRRQERKDKKRAAKAGMPWRPDQASSAMSSPAAAIPNSPPAAQAGVSGSPHPHSDPSHTAESSMIWNSLHEDIRQRIETLGGSGVLVMQERDELLPPPVIPEKKRWSFSKPEPIYQPSRLVQTCMQFDVFFRTDRVKEASADVVVDAAAVKAGRVPPGTHEKLLQLGYDAPDPDGGDILEASYSLVLDFPTPEQIATLFIESFKVLGLKPGDVFVKAHG